MPRTGVGTRGVVTSEGLREKVSVSVLAEVPVFRTVQRQGEDYRRGRRDRGRRGLTCEGASKTCPVYEVGPVEMATTKGTDLEWEKGDPFYADGTQGVGDESTMEESLREELPR